MKRMVMNRTRKTILCRKTEVARSFCKRARGLMFRKGLPKDSGMLFIFPKAGRHSFWTPFMRFPIDIIFIDSSKRVVDTGENIKPWHACSPKADAGYVLELRAGTIRETMTRTGDLLYFRA